MAGDQPHCNGCKCPVKDSCSRFLAFIPPDFPVRWFDKAPYEPDAGCCPEFKPHSKEKEKWQNLLPTFGMI